MYKIEVAYNMTGQTDEVKQLDENLVQKTTTMKTTMNFIKKLSLAACMCFLFVGVASAQKKEALDGLRAIELEKPAKAVTDLTKALETSPDVPQLYYYLGYAQMMAGNEEEAAKTFEKGIATYPKEPMTYAGKGHLLLKKNPAEGKKNLDNALALSKSKNAEVLQAVARAYSSDPKTVTTAITLLEKAKSLEPQNSETYILLGDAYLIQNNGGSAASSYEWAAQYNPKRATSHYKIGKVYQRAGNTKVAEESFLKAVEVDPEYALAHKELGEFYYLQKEGPKAVTHYQKYLSSIENPEKDQTRYAFLLFMAKDYTKANEIFAKLVEDPNVKPTALRYYSYSLFEAGDLQKSRAIFDRYFAVVAKDQIEANDYAYHGRLLLKLNEDSLATISLASSLALNANQADIATALAETYLKTKKYDDAIRTYKALIKSRPKPSAMDYFSIGRAYYYSEKFAPADSAFTKLTEMQPNVVASYFWKARSQSNLDPDSKAGLAKPAYEMVIEKALATPEKYKNELIEAYLYLGGYYAEKDDINKTREYFKKVIAIDPNHEQAKKALELLK